MVKVHIDKLVFGGQAMGRVENKIAFIWGAYPGEDVEIEVTKMKKNFIEGVASKIITTSPDRIEPSDGHYLSCSPWQTLKYEKENVWKKRIAEETYFRIAGIKVDLDILAPKDPYGYRNKIEYNFTKDKKGHLSLAFHDRGTHRLAPLERCVLADNKIQEASIEIITSLRKGMVSLSVLKSLIVRSDGGGRVAAALFVTDKKYINNFFVPPLGSLSGLQIYYSNPFSPASIPTELIFSSGDSELETRINDVPLKFGLLSFFQINPSIFELAIKEISKHIKGEKVFDFYGGVGAICMSLHGTYREAVLVEENEEAIDFAAKNLAINGFKNIVIKNGVVENSSEQISNDDIVILDPPRVGLHRNVLNYLLEKQPKKIIYLSCSVDTHARDVSLLFDKYKATDWKLFNFFPRTPHIESLCVLERK